MSAHTQLDIGGLTPFSTVDYPGYLSAVVFCQGCPWRCPYCHNTHLLARKNRTAVLAWEGIVDWLDGRRGLLEAVVFSGGEPLLQKGLSVAMQQVRKMGLRVGLHTAGIYPERLARVLPFVDWVGFDVKAPFDDYSRLTGGTGGRRPREALTQVIVSGRANEVRCTVDETLLSIGDAVRMGEQLSRMGVMRIVLQARRTPDGLCGTISPSFVSAISGKMRAVELRGA